MILTDTLGRVLTDANGLPLSGGARPTARVALTILAGADAFIVSLAEASPGVSHIWIGASRFRTIAIADLPATLAWSDVTVGLGASVRLQGGADGQPPSWWQLVSRGEFEEEELFPIGEIADVNKVVGDPATIINAAIYFTGENRVFSMTVDGAAPSGGDAINATTGQVTISHTAARNNAIVVVRATIGSEIAEQAFSVTTILEQLPAPPVFVGDPPDVLATVGGTITVDLAPFVTGETGWELTSVTGGPPDGFSITSAGVFSAPTAAAYASANVEVTASNSGGSVLLRFSVTVEAASTATPIAANPGPSIRLRAGGNGFVGSIVETFGALWTGPARTLRWLWFKDGVKVNAAASLTNPNDGNWATANGFTTLAAGVYTAKVAAIETANTANFLILDTDNSVTITAQQVSSGALGPASTAMMTEAMAQGLPRYDFLEFSLRNDPYSSGAVSNKARVFLAQIFALAAFTGVTTSYGGNTPAQRVAAYLNHWASNGMPAARSGVAAQCDQQMAVLALLGKRTPAVWGLVGAANRTRIDIVMEGLGVSAAWQNSDNNPVVRGTLSGSERTIVGGPWGRGRVPNFTTPSVLMPMIVNEYMGGGTALEDYMRTFSRAAYVSRIVSTGVQGGALKDIYDTFRQNWTGGPSGRGPTAAELEAAVSRGPSSATSRYKMCNNLVSGGFHINEYKTAVTSQLEKVFGKPITPGFLYGAGDNIPTGCTRVAGEFGIFENRIGSLGRARQVGCLSRDLVDRLGNTIPGRTQSITGQQAWDQGLHPYGGPNGSFTGMLTELDASDADGKRSSMKYAGEGITCLFPLLGVVAALDLVSPTDADVAPLFGRTERGMVDWAFRNLYGHAGFAKGGQHGANDGTSVDWYKANADALSQDTLADIWFKMVAPWTGWPTNSVVPAITGGPAQVGQTLTLGNGTWLNSPTFTRKWQQKIGSVWTDIAGATGPTFVPTTAQLGRPLRGFVFAAAGIGTARAISGATANVIAA